MRRVGEDQRERAIRQDVPDRLPIDPGRFHCDVRASVSGKPIGQGEQPGRGSTERPHFGPRLGIGRPSNGRDNAILVHIQTRATWVNDLHDRSPHDQRSPTQSPSA
jgi:hypothetical protein